ncbi:MAG: hypothetical protein GX047_07340 [Firmicutes bacterium]|nr:hypothetical protein [Bacillota bacterium]
MLRIVIGRAGVGKTHRCLTEIVQELKRDPAGPPLILVVPAESTFAMEQALLRGAELPGMCRVEVLGFRRLLWRILQSAGGVPETPLSDQGRKLLLASLLHTLKDELTIFRDSAEHWGFVERLSRTIQELEQAGHGVDAAGRESQAELDEAARWISLEAIQNAYGSEDILQAKARDLALIWTAYRGKLAELGLTDGDHCWQRAIQGVDKARFLDEAEFWIDGINGFRLREKQLIGELLGEIRQMTITLRLDPLALWEGNSEVFAYSLAALDELIGLAREAGIPHQVETLTGEGELAPIESHLEFHPALGKPPLPRRFRDREELAHLEEQLCCPKGTRTPFPHVPYNLKVVSPSNRRDEVEQVARYLIGQARERGIRWRDMAVAVSDLSLYEGILTEVFSDCGIPFFLDQSRPVHWHPLVVFLSGVMELLTRGWRTETVIQILKSDMISTSRSIIDQLENYLLANGIDGELWINPAVQERLRRVFTDEAHLEQLLGPLLRLYEQLHGMGEVLLSGTELMTALWSLIEEYGIPERIDYWASLEVGQDDERPSSNYSAWNREEAEHVDIWNLWVELVDDFMQTLGKQLMTPAQFANMLQAGLDNLRLTRIPQGLDQVLVTSPLRILNSEVRVLAVLGADEQHLQLAGGEDTILSDAERRALQAVGWSLEPQGELQRLREPLLLYSLLTRARDGLYISSPLADGDGKALEPAGVVKDIRALFPHHDLDEPEICLPCTIADAARFTAKALRAVKDGLQQASDLFQDGFVLGLYQWLVDIEQGRPALRRCLAGLGYTTKAGPLSSTVVQQFCGDMLMTNVYQLEAAAQCPYQYFAGAVLRLEERERLQWDARVEGQLWHEALALLARYLLETGQDLAEMGETSLRELADEVWCDAAARLAPLYAVAVESYNYRIERLGRGFQRIVEVLAEHSRRGQFRPAAVEVAFGLSRGIPPLRLELQPEGTVLIRGRIDRIETVRAGDTLYVRIIDFKRGTRKLKLSDVYYGFSLQLLVYLAALLDNAQAILPEELGRGRVELVPAGVLYFPLSEPIVKVDGPVDEETLAKKLLAKYKTSGLLLADTDVLELMDAEISGRSELLPVGIKKDGEIYKGSSAYSLEELELLVTYVKGLIRNLADAIRAGKIDIEPYRKTNTRACRYCPYTAVCRFELGVPGCRYRYITEIGDEEVLKMIKTAAAKEALGTDEVERGCLVGG